MRIAIQAADLDWSRIDGTRVYILNMLNRFGEFSPSDDFFIYHKKDFNPELTPKKFSNYRFISKPFPFCWTQMRFAAELWKENYDRLWMPMQSLPFVRRKNLVSTVTIHDLAFKYFPDFFPRKDLRRLNLFSGFAIKNADRIIAVSDATKKDILKFFPEIGEEKIKVIHHGFDKELFEKEISESEKEKIYTKYQILDTPPHRRTSRYILYVGAIQPRKNLEVLIDAFGIIKKDHPDLKLVLAGEKAWLWEGIMEKIEKSPHKKDIIVTGTVGFRDKAAILKGAEVFVFPSLYEGFGIPVLEAMACGIPVITAKNSSLPEAGGEAALYFDEKSAEDLSEKIKMVLKFSRDLIPADNLRNNLIEKGREQIKKFSWEKCARETAEYIRK